MSIKKIVIVGPESTGKTTLCELLATHYHSIYCPEYAREYLLTHGNNYKYEDLLNIAKAQLQQEDTYTQQLLELSANSSATKNIHPYLFIDTDMYVMKVWCEFVFDQCHKWILDQITDRRYDLYLLCKPDLPWVKDELREYPDLERRLKLYHYYKDLLVHQSTPWAEISGNYEERLQQAIAATDSLHRGRMPELHM